MSDEDHQADLAALEATRTKLSEALDALEETVAAGEADPSFAHVAEALRALDEMREYVVRDLGTAVLGLQSINSNMTNLGNYVGGQRDAINDLSSTLAATVSLLLDKGVITPEALTSTKAKIISDAAAESDTSDKDLN